MPARISLNHGSQLVAVSHRSHACIRGSRPSTVTQQRHGSHGAAFAAPHGCHCRTIVRGAPCACALAADSVRHLLRGQGDAARRGGAPCACSRRRFPSGFRQTGIDSCGKTLRASSCPGTQDAGLASWLTPLTAARSRRPRPESAGAGIQIYSSPGPPHVESGKAIH